MTNQRGAGRMMKAVLITLGGLVGLVLIVFLALRVGNVYAITQPAPGEPCCVAPGDVGFAYDDVTFTSGDGTTLSGWYVPSRNGAVVILLHGYGNDRAQMWPRAEPLARAGYGVLLYDLRGHGRSTPTLRAYGWADVADVDAALAFLAGRPDVDPDRVGIFGFSIGGQIALRAAASTERISAVAADGPSVATALADTPERASFGERLAYLSSLIEDQGIVWRTGLQPPAGVTHIIARIAPRPLLLIASGAELDRVRRYYALAGEPKAIWEIPEAGHGEGPEARPDEYAAQVVAFFDAALPAR